MNRFLVSLVLLTALVAATSVHAQTPDNPTRQDPPQNPPQTPPPPPRTPEQLGLPPSDPPFWTKRRVNLVLGFGSAAAAGFIAVQRDRDLRARKLDLQALPPGSNDEWAKQYDEAKGVMKDRNFWASVAAGVGGVTLTYMFTSRSQGIRPLRGGAAYIWSF